MKNLYNKVNDEICQLLTLSYSTSFSLGIKLFNKKLRSPIYAIYAFARIADEIVDTFHDSPKKELIERYEKETYLAIEQKISTNPVLHAFQNVVREYNIDKHLIDSFLESMKMDLDSTIVYDKETYEKYILGSAQVIGLMCLKVFVKGSHSEYEKLKPMAMSLGSAFQKVNFLRDAYADYNQLNRVYFPNINFEDIKQADLNAIFLDIQNDFDHALVGIKNLPTGSKFGVFLAYRYYNKLFLKIKKISSDKFLEERIRIPNYQKANILVRSLVRYQINYL